MRTIDSNISVQQVEYRLADSTVIINYLQHAKSLS